MSLLYLYRSFHMKTSKARAYEVPQDLVPTQTCPTEGPSTVRLSVEDSVPDEARSKHLHISEIPVR